LPPVETKTLQKMKLIFKKAFCTSVIGISFITSATAQVADTPNMEDDDIYVLSPFEVTQSDDVGYLATNTLAGTRIRTQLKDVGSAVSVITKEFLEDTGATDNKSLLVYTANTEVGGSLGNYTGANISTYAEETSFSNPNGNTRVRGLTSADNTRNYFLTNIPWDGYNVTRVDLQRGPNSILFGLGSPSGIINNSLASADFYDSREIKVTADEYGTFRMEGNFNQVILEDELAVHISLLDEQEKYKQQEAFEDDQRFYAAVKYKPEFLQTDSISTTISANYENGNITRNSPRMVTPIDNITAWFASSANRGYGLDKQTFDPYDIQNNDPDDNVGQAGEFYKDGSTNPNYLPALGNYAQLYGETLVIFGDASTYPTRTIRSEAAGYHGLSEIVNADGTYKEDGSIGGLKYGRPASVAGYSSYATRAHLPNSDMGQYKDFQLTDSSIFDFYNHILDGNNKHEWQDFEDYSVTLNQTFFNNKLGYEVAYDHQNYEQGKESLFDGTRYAIYMDVNEYLNDGSKNPNVGRAFVSDSLMYGNNNSVHERETTKAQIFGEFDTRDYFGETLLTKILGKHMLSGIASKDESESDDRSWYRYYMDDAYRGYIKDQSYGSSLVDFTYYLGDSMKSRSSASGAYLPTMVDDIDLTSDSIYMFDSTWNATNVSPSDDWDADENGTIYKVDDDDNEIYYQVNANGEFIDEEGKATTDSSKYVEGDSSNGKRVHAAGEYQSENPDNYVGWTSMPYTVNKTSVDDRDNRTYSAKKIKKKITSKAFVYQAYLWDDSIVGTYGWRKDKAESWDVKATEDQKTKLAHLDDTYSYSDDSYKKVEGETTSWSVVAHINSLLGKYDVLPFNVSLYYSQSENFQPNSSRVDVFGQPLEAPSGDTVDKSIAISTKDNRYTLKLTKFTTTVLNDTATGLNTWVIGAAEAWGANWCNVFEHNIVNGFTLDDVASPGQTNDRYDYQPGQGENVADAAAREAAAVAAWRAHQQRMQTLFPTFYKNWVNGDVFNDYTEFTFSGPSGFAITQDTISEGYELEFIANPTDNWRITFNASKTEASRSNVGGEAFLSYINVMLDDINNTAAGDLRYWGGNASNDTAKLVFMNNVGSSWSLVKLKEGSNVDELRKWHFNLITNYSFTEGIFKGFNVGAGYRWMDRNVIGYPLIKGADGETTYDLENPYHGPSLDYYDFWIGYKCSLTDKVDWKIQVNVKNAFTGNELIPLSTQPDGTPAAWYIGARRKISVTNTFTF
jgi:hypothetical protein